MDIAQEITAGILAGGQARRMGGIDKGLIPLGGKTMIEHVLACLVQQSKEVIINANRNLDRYRTLGYQVVADQYTDSYGPLAGIASLMQQIETPYLLVVPCDSPFISDILAKQLYQALIDRNFDIATAHDGKRLQPVFSLLKTNLLNSLTCFIEQGGRKIDSWFQQTAYTLVNFQDHDKMFININTPEEQQAAEEMLKDINH